MQRSKWLPFMISALLLLLSLSCNFPVPQDSEPSAATSPVEDPNAILTQVSAAVATGSESGEIVIELTESQLTAAANEALQNQGQETIRNLQIELDNGLVTATGKMDQNGIDFPVTLIFSITVDSSGSPYVNIQEGKLGPFPLPQNILDQLKVQFDQILKSQISAISGDIFVKNISINAGTLLVIAERR